MHAQIIDCSPILLFVITIMLQLKNYVNNFFNEALWILGSAGSAPPPGVNIPKLLPSPAWQWLASWV